MKHLIFRQNFLTLGKFYTITHIGWNTLHQKELEHLFEKKDLGIILDAVLSLMITFVKPHLECGQVIWAPYLKKYVVILENLQHQATKFVDGFYRLS